MYASEHNSLRININNKGEETQLKNPYQVQRLHDLYRKALKVEFDLHKRSPEFIQDLIEVTTKK